jgi:hypothetical protein
MFLILLAISVAHQKKLISSTFLIFLKIHPFSADDGRTSYAVTHLAIATDLQEFSKNIKLESLC